MGNALIMVVTVALLIAPGDPGNTQVVQADSARTAAAVSTGTMPQALLETIDKTIKLLEDKQIPEALRLIVSPRELKEILEKTTFDNLVKSFQGEKAEVLLGALKGARTLTPKLESEGQKAIFPQAREQGIPRTMIFFLEEGAWYLSD